jgi:hypothetical protein
MNAHDGLAPRVAGGSSAKIFTTWPSVPMTSIVLAITRAIRKGGACSHRERTFLNVGRHCPA